MRSTLVRLVAIGIALAIPAAATAGGLLGKIKEEVKKVEGGAPSGGDVSGGLKCTTETYNKTQATRDNCAQRLEAAGISNDMPWAKATKVIQDGCQVKNPYKEEMPYPDTPAKYWIIGDKPQCVWIQASGNKDVVKTFHVTTTCSEHKTDTANGGYDCCKFLNLCS